MKTKVKVKKSVVKGSKTKRPGAGISKPIRFKRKAWGVINVEKGKLTEVETRDEARKLRDKGQIVKLDITVVATPAKKA